MAVYFSSPLSPGVPSLKDTETTPSKFSDFAETSVTGPGYNEPRAVPLLKLGAAASELGAVPEEEPGAGLGSDGIADEAALDANQPPANPTPTPITSIIKPTSTRRAIPDLPGPGDVILVFWLQHSSQLILNYNGRYLEYTVMMRLYIQQEEEKKEEEEQEDAKSLA
jgi:hypothetical protein